MNLPLGQSDNTNKAHFVNNFCVSFERFFVNDVIHQKSKAYFFLQGVIRLYALVKLFFKHFDERFLNEFEETEKYKCVVEMFLILEYLLTNEEIQHLWFQDYRYHSIHDIIGRGFCHCLYHSNPSIYIRKFNGHIY